MYEKIHRWVDEEQVDVSDSKENERAGRDESELEELVGHRIREIESDDD